MPPIPTPPPDASGGFMTIQYTNGTDTHRMRVHVLPFSLTEFVVGGVAGTGDDGNHDYAYTGTRPAGSEMGINDTFAAFLSHVAAYYSAAWTFSLHSLHQIQGGVPVQIFPIPTPTAVVGTSTVASPGGQFRALEHVFNFRTSAGMRARIVHISDDSTSLYTPGTVAASTAGGATRDQTYVAYLTGANTGLVAHDGNKLISPAHVTWAINRRLRRHYQYN